MKKYTAITAFDDQDEENAVWIESDTDDRAVLEQLAKKESALLYYGGDEEEEITQEEIECHRVVAIFPGHVCV